jgi:hypothetical protein
MRISKTWHGLCYYIVVDRNRKAGCRNGPLDRGAGEVPPELPTDEPVKPGVPVPHYPAEH